MFSQMYLPVLMMLRLIFEQSHPTFTASRMRTRSASVIRDSQILCCRGKTAGDALPRLVISSVSPHEVIPLRLEMLVALTSIYVPGLATASRTTTTLTLNLPPSQ